MTAFGLALEADQDERLAAGESLPEVGQGGLWGVLGVQIRPVPVRERRLLPGGVVRALVAHPALLELPGDSFRLGEQVGRRSQFRDVLVDRGVEPARRLPDDTDQRLVAVQIDQPVLERGDVGVAEGPGHTRGVGQPAEKPAVTGDHSHAAGGSSRGLGPRGVRRVMHDSILDTIGSPLVSVDAPAGATVAAKVESFNPGGSAKDRPAKFMIERAQKDGTLSAGDTLVEPTSGNTGIGMAMVGAVTGYDVVLVMPSSKSPERRQIMKAYGAEIELVEGDISAAKDRADELTERDGYVQLRQFDNPANPDAHYETTGAEIVEQVGDRTVDALVAGVGTGGTISGTGRRLREAFPDMDVVAVEPADNAVLSGLEPGTGEDSFQGMGPGFISPNTDVDLIDDVVTVELDDAEAECRRLAREEGIFVGQSSGASNLAAREWAGRLLDAGVEDPLVVTVYWDSGERYMSTGMFD